MLDFDFEKLCSVSLSNNNVYACLVCGKYFQGVWLCVCVRAYPDSVVMESVCVCHAGRGGHSHAYTHSVQLLHHVWLNLTTLKFYCLPDNYEIIDPSLEDIKVGAVCYHCMLYTRLSCSTCSTQHSLRAKLSS